MDAATRGVVSWLELPSGITELVLSFLSVPELSRMRSVCKDWNKIISRASFHDLCDLNGGSREYLFMWGEVSRTKPLRVVIDPTFSDTLCFLDVDAQRWYSIPAPRPRGRGHEVESRFMTVSDGLVCELTAEKSCAGNTFALSVSDPIARTWRSLPDPTENFVARTFHLVFAQIVTTVENAARSFKVFLVDNSSQYTYPPRGRLKLYVHESLTNMWRTIQNVPDNLKSEHAIVFQESLFLLKEDDDSRCLSLFRYRFQEDTWAEVYRMRFSSRRNIYMNPTLVLSGNRLFMNVWLKGPLISDWIVNPIVWQSDPDCLEPGAFSTGTHLEMYEILIPDNRRRLVVRLDNAQLERIFGCRLRSSDIHLEQDDHELKMSYAFPYVNSDGVCSSVVLVSTRRRRGFVLRRYDLATGSVVVLPPHPSEQFSMKPGIGNYYVVENMKLSLRNMLARIS